MIKIIKSPSNELFYNLVSDSKKSIYLCSPFIKNNIIEEILHRRKSNVDTVVITSPNIANFLSGSLEISAIKTLLNKGVSVRNYQNLHAKIYLFDNKKALITSANLTYYGLFRNYEYGVLIEDEKNVVDQIYNDYIQMTCDDECSTFNLDSLYKLEEETNYLSKPLVRIDEENDTLLLVKDIFKLTANMSSWQQDVFHCINKIVSSTFTLDDIYKFEIELNNIHPNNNNIKPKIRQILQQIRDMGFIKFTNRGTYKKLWISGDLSIN